MEQKLTEAQEVISSKEEQLHRQEQALSGRHMITSKDRPSAPRGAAAPFAAATSPHYGRDYDAHHGDRESAHPPGQSRCGSFDARDLDEKYPSEIVEEEVAIRQPSGVG